MAEDQPGKQQIVAIQQIEDANYVELTCGHIALCLLDINEYKIGNMIHCGRCERQAKPLVGPLTQEMVAAWRLKSNGIIVANPDSAMLVEQAQSASILATHLLESWREWTEQVDYLNRQKRQLEGALKRAQKEGIERANGDEAALIELLDALYQHQSFMPGTSRQYDAIDAAEERLKALDYGQREWSHHRA